MNSSVLIGKVLIPLLCLVAGGTIGFKVRDGMVREDGRRMYTAVREGSYRFINPLLECDSDRDVLRNYELQPFKDKVEAYLRNRMRYEGVESVSIYFRELNDGLWFLTGDAERFTPASMRKVPTMIAILKQAERKPGLLTSRITARLKQDYNAYQNFRPQETLMSGREYTVADLINRMIVHSDNNAFMLLSGIVDPSQLQQVYSLLAVRGPKEARPSDFLSVQTYASFFRILYNATYLNKDMSDLALEMLSRIDFRAGIVKGVAPTITVAHKFGEHSDEGTGKKQLHDCGIVYHPAHPYLLCIMSRGTSFEYLDDTIASISRIIYTEVEYQHQTGHL